MSNSHVTGIQINIMNNLLVKVFSINKIRHNNYFVSDDLDIAVNSIDLALEHPDLVTDLEPTDILLEHPDITEPTDGVYDIVSEHPKIALNPIDIDLEPTDLALEHPNVVVEPESIEVEPGDIVLEHPKIAYTSKDIDVEPDEIALDHFKVAVEPNYIKVEPNDLVLEHPKIVVNQPDIDIEPDDLVLEHPKVAVRDKQITVEPTDLAIEHPKVTIQHDLDLEPNEVVLEHPKILKKFYPINVEPNFIATEHPKILNESKGINVEPTDLVIEHPKIAKEATMFNVEPSDIVLEHPDLANLPTDNFISQRRNQTNTISPSTESNLNKDPKPVPRREFEALKSTSQSFNDPIKLEPNQSKMYKSPDPKHPNEPGTSERSSVLKTPLEPETPPKSDPFETMREKENSSDDFGKFNAYRKMAEEQIKQPGMDIDSIDIVPRVMWNAAEPKYTIPLTKPIKAVLATYTGTGPCFDDMDCKRIIQNLQTTQMEQLNMPDIQWK